MTESEKLYIYRSHQIPDDWRDFVRDTTLRGLPKQHAKHDPESYIGKQIGSLIVLKITRSDGPFRRCEAVCSCGRYKGEYRLDKIIGGYVEQCPLCAREKVLAQKGKKEREFSVAGVGRKIINTFNGIRKRVSEREEYVRRGISIEPFFQDFKRFKSWIIDFVDFKGNDLAMAYCLNLSIDRVDNDRGYERDNLTWSTDIEQAQNRSNTIWITHEGMRMTLTDFARKINAPYSTVYKRYQEVSDPVFVANSFKEKGAQLELWYTAGAKP